MSPRKGALSARNPPPSPTFGHLSGHRPATPSPATVGHTHWPPSQSTSQWLLSPATSWGPIKEGPCSWPTSCRAYRPSEAKHAWTGEEPEQRGRWLPTFAWDSAETDPTAAKEGGTCQEPEGGQSVEEEEQHPPSCHGRDWQAAPGCRPTRVRRGAQACVQRGRWPPTFASEPHPATSLDEEAVAVEEERHHPSCHGCDRPRYSRYQQAAPGCRPTRVWRGAQACVPAREQLEQRGRWLPTFVGGITEPCPATSLDEEAVAVEEEHHPSCHRCDRPRYSLWRQAAPGCRPSGEQRGAQTCVPAREQPEQRGRWPPTFVGGSREKLPTTAKEEGTSQASERGPSVEEEEEHQPSCHENHCLLSCNQRWPSHSCGHTGEQHGAPP